MLLRAHSGGGPGQWEWGDLISVAHDNDGNGSVRLAEGAGRTCRDAMVIFLFLGTVLSRPHLFFWGGGPG